jgi:trk system potassium uptake protein TrkA
MGHTNNHVTIIVGCGRVGVELAQSISRQGRMVAVIDSNTRAFDRLGAEFQGRMVQGDALDADALRRAGIEGAHALAAVTSSDSANIVTARVARDLFHVPHVVARVYDPRRAPIYEKLGLQTIASSSWGALRIEQLLLHSGMESVCVAGNGEVQIYEITVPVAWHDRPVSELLPGGDAVLAALARGGRGQLAGGDLTLQSGDLLQVSATAAGAAALHARLGAAGKE